ncbi:hypothetical protein [Streptomyces globisporus]|uniref:hypothetical protein n=1 Tax=Streptomyces globisporus TaxID=1908 RepID=UPI00177C866F|nr:hypothetical protein GCM10010264_74180 [Streptomyces globisporus]
MIVRFVDGPLAGHEMETTNAPWAGEWLTVEGAADWGLYVPVLRTVHGVVMAEARITIPRR